LAVLENQTKEI